MRVVQSSNDTARVIGDTRMADTRLTLVITDLRAGQTLFASGPLSVDALIPSFVKRSGRKDYLVGSARLLKSGGDFGAPRTPLASTVSSGAQLLDYDPDAETRLLAALLYQYSTEPLQALRSRAAALSCACVSPSRVR